jgi:DNA polymerase-3 subunit alpha (Gram-positive type)
LLVEKSTNDGYIVGSRGSVGSSLIAYICNISEVNPLMPHYLCKKCHHIEFIDQIDDGNDLRNKNCPICNEIMTGHGHNLPFETFLGTSGEKIPDIDLNFSGIYQSKAHEFIKNMFGKKNTFRAGTILTVAEKTAKNLIRKYFEITKPDKRLYDSEIEWIVGKCIDVKRTAGQHPGGIIVVPEEKNITDFTPYNLPPDAEVNE